MTCSDDEVFEITNPGLISRIWNFTVTVMTQVQDGTLEMTSGMWKKCILVSRVVIGKGWNGPEYIWIGMVSWTQEKFARLSDFTWNGARLLGKLLWNCAKWFAGVTWNGFRRLAEFIWSELQWLVDFTINTTYSFAEMVQNKSAELTEIMINGVMWIVEPFVPVVHYVTDVTVEFYFGSLHGKSSVIKSEFPFDGSQPA